MRGKFAQAASHDLFETSIQSPFRVSEIIVQQQFRGQYLILITSARNKQMLLTAWNVKNIAHLSVNYGDKFLPKGNQSAYCPRKLFAKLFGGSLYNKTSICPLTDLRLCEHSIYLIYEKKMCKGNLCKLNWSSNQDVVVSYNKSECYVTLACSNEQI